MRAFGGMGKTKKIVINPDFLPRQTFWYFHWQDISSCFLRENEVTELKSTEERVAQTSRLSVKRDAPLRLPPNEGPFLKGPYLWRYGTHIHETGHSVVKNYSSVWKWHIVAKKKCWSVWTGRTTVNIAKECCLYLDSFGCVKINVSRFQARDACQMR